MTHRGIKRSRGVLLAASSTVALSALLLAGCSTGGDATSTDGGGVGTADAPVDIKVLVNDAYGAQWTEKLLPEFKKDFPNINVTIDGLPYNDQLAKTMLELTNPTPTYDVAREDDNWTSQLASTGGLVDLRGDAVSKWTDADYDRDDFYPASLAAGQYDGKQVWVPARSNILMMLYNKTMYTEAGLPEPTPELTWDEYMTQADALVRDTDGDGVDDVWAVGTYFVRDGLTPTIWQTIMNSNGGTILNEDNTKAALGDEAVAALETHQQ